MRMRSGLPMMIVSTGFTDNVVVSVVSKAGIISNQDTESFAVKIVKRKNKLMALRDCISL